MSRYRFDYFVVIKLRIKTGILILLKINGKIVAGMGKRFTAYFFHRSIRHNRIQLIDIHVD